MFSKGWSFTGLKESQYFQSISEWWEGDKLCIKNFYIFYVLFTLFLMWQFIIECVCIQLFYVCLFNYLQSSLSALIWWSMQVVSGKHLFFSLHFDKENENMSVINLADFVNDEDFSYISSPSDLSDKYHIKNIIGKYVLFA